jgi:hypothetical protein
VSWFLFDADANLSIVTWIKMPPMFSGNSSFGGLDAVSLYGRRE